MRMHRSAGPAQLVLAAVIGASMLSVGACGRPAASGEVQSPPPAATSGAVGSTAMVTASEVARATPAGRPSLPRGWRRCVNKVTNYSIGYPRNWHTTQIRPSEVCTQFHPDRFTIPPESEYPLTALNARRVTALPSRTDTEYERVLLWRKTTVAGRQAVRFETVSTGAGLYQAGTRQYGYVIRLGGALISVHTTAEPGETRYAAWKTVVDKAARTLRRAEPSPAHHACVPIRPELDFYEGGRIATEKVTTPRSRCTTISVSHVVDAANPADRCQTFLIAFWPMVDNSLTYTEPVTACGDQRTVLARNVPDNAEYQVLYAIDYLEPEVQTVRFKVWH